MAATVQRLKARSHDADLGSRISLAKTVAGRASAAKLIASRDKLLHGPDAAGSAPGVRARRKRSRR